MGLSVTDPIERAIDRTKTILFQPFLAGKWFALGFSAFLAQLGSGAGNINSFQNLGGRTRAADGLKSFMDPAKDWVMAHMAIIIVGLAALLLIGLVLAWLKARGQFMFLDGVAHNRGNVAEPWCEYAREGNSLFGFNIVFGILVLLGIVVIVGLGFVLALPDIRAEEFGRPAITALLVGIPLLLVFLIATAIIGVLLHDFVIPAMYLRRQGAMEAWGTVHREVIAGQMSTIILYFLMKLVISMAIGILALLGTCFTCCCAILPYIGTVILLPLFVFHRSYSLCFLEQLGAGWKCFVDQETAIAEVGSGNA